jgi:hypothetical protein
MNVGGDPEKCCAIRRHRELRPAGGLSGRSRQPAGVAGNYEIPAGESATALKACKAAVRAADAPRRIWFELGRAHEFSHQRAEAVRVYRKAVEAGSTSAMVGLGGLCAKGAGVKKGPSGSTRASCSSRRPPRAISLG